MEQEQKTIRRSVSRLIALATLIFFALLLLGRFMRVQIPRQRLQRLETLIAAGGTHFALLLSDGSVKVFGENGHGEAETADWILKVTP